MLQDPTAAATAANVALSPTVDASAHGAEGDAMEMEDLGGLFDENGVEAGGAEPWTKSEDWETEWEADASDFWAPEATPADVPQGEAAQPASGTPCCYGLDAFEGGIAKTIEHAPVAGQTLSARAHEKPSWQYHSQTISSASGA